MRGNTSSRRNFEPPPIETDQIDEVFMEARIARIESDVENIKDNIQHIHIEMREFRGELKAANEAIARLDAKLDRTTAELSGKIDRFAAELKGEMGAMEARLDGRIDASEQRTDAKLHAMETRLIKWIIAMTLATASTAFSIAKFVN